MPDIDLDPRDYRHVAPLSRNAIWFWAGAIGILGALYVYQFSSGWSEALMAVSCLIAGSKYRSVAGPERAFHISHLWPVLGWIAVITAVIMLERSCGQSPSGY